MPYLRAEGSKLDVEGNPSASFKYLKGSVQCDENDNKYRKPLGIKY